MISRIRRDTRFTKDKTLYREHVWATFVRPKKEFPCSPAFWFEITPQGYTCGVGYYCTTPQLMQAYRDAILADPAAFRRAVRKAERAGFAFGGESYKKDKPGNVPEDLRTYYNQKDAFVCRENPSLAPLRDAGIIEEFKKRLPGARAALSFFAKRRANQSKCRLKNQQGKAFREPPVENHA